MGGSRGSRKSAKDEKKNAATAAVACTGWSADNLASPKGACSETVAGLQAPPSLKSTTLGLGIDFQTTHLKPTATLREGWGDCASIPASLGEQTRHS